MIPRVGIIEDAAVYYHCSDCVTEKHLTPFEIGVTQDGGTLILMCLLHEKEVGRFALSEPANTTCNCGTSHHTTH